ncbi:MAG: 4-hydroxy-tetrahydrodipicolinate synthase [Halieaceae bacterium]|jgi:4-hydroxy-tetrahydrodipicolinate synthase
MITGSLVALVTPMLVDGSIDWESLDGLVAWHMEQGTSAIVAVGTTGESATLSVEEHCAVIERVVKTVATGTPVIAGTGANCTREAIQLTRSAQRSGADACLLVTPYYNKPTQEGLFRHHREIAAAVDIPQILYNVPGRTGVDMLPDTVERLSHIHNIVGIKEATGDMDRAREIIARSPADFAVYSGDDGTACELMLMGGHGNISVTANVAPTLMAQLCELALGGETAAARDLDRRLQPLHDALFCESNPIPVKWALQHMGRIGDGIRLPLSPLAEEYHPLVADALAAVGLT